MVVAVPVNLVAVIMVVLAAEIRRRRARIVFGRRLVRPPRLAEEVGREPGADRGHHRGERPEDGDHRVHQRIAQADRIDPGLRRRDQERDRRALGRALLSQPERGRQDAAGAER